MTSIAFKARLMGMTLDDYARRSSTYEYKGARYVRDADWWGVPAGTLIVPGMKPKGRRKGGKSPVAKAPKAHPEYNDEVFKSRHVTPRQTPSMSDEQFQRVQDRYQERYDLFKETYVKRTSKPVRDSGDYEGVTHAEMWDDWAAERTRYTTGTGNRIDNRPRKEQETHQAFQSYAEDGYLYMNALGRQDDNKLADLSSDEVEEYVDQMKLMDEAMRPVGRNIVVHRNSAAPFFSNLNVGDQFRDQGYTSTTVLEGYLDEVKDDLYMDEQDDLMSMEIRVPAEAKAMYITALQNQRRRDADIGEGELLMARGTEYRVVSIEDGHMVLEVVPPDTEGSTHFDPDYVYRDAKMLIHDKRVEEEGEDEW